MVHLLDWHLVPPEHLNPPGQPGLIVTGHRAGCTPNTSTPSSRSSSEHEAILRRLAKNHGTLTVYVEGLTEAEVELFTEKAKQLAKVDAEDIPETRRMLDEVNAMKQTGAAKATADELRQMLKGHRVEMLKTGATVRLIGEGLVEVKALDDADALKRARPDKEGAIDAAANAEREEEMAKRLAEVRGLRRGHPRRQARPDGGAEEVGAGREVPARRDGGVPGGGGGVVVPEDAPDRPAAPLTGHRRGERIGPAS